MAFTPDLDLAAGPQAVYNLKRAALEPFGQKPFGWNWIAETALLVGEYGTPSVTGGNGHLYRVMGAGQVGTVAQVTTFFTQNAHVGPFFYVTQVKLTASAAGFVTTAPVAFSGLTSAGFLD